MISFSKFISLKEALSLDDPLAQSTLKITDKSSQNITFEFTFDNDNYQISITKLFDSIFFDNNYTRPLGELNFMGIYLKANGNYALTNKMGMQANIIYNMLLNAIKQAHDHFGEIDGYIFSGAHPNQNIMYDRLMKRFAPNLITWSHLDGIYLKPEAVQKLKEQNPDLINQINDHIHQATSERDFKIQQNKKNRNLERLSRRTP